MSKSKSSLSEALTGLLVAAIASIAQFIGWIIKVWIAAVIVKRVFGL